MNRVALQQFVDIGLNISDPCFERTVGPAEDQFISKCFFEHMGVNITDSHDPITGEQLFHHWNAGTTYTASAGTGQNYIHRAKRAWSILPHPSTPDLPIGELTGLEAAGKYSIAFHMLKTPVALARGVRRRAALLPE